MFVFNCQYWFSHTDLTAANGMWTGLNDRQTEGKFMWADGTPPGVGLV